MRNRGACNKAALQLGLGYILEVQWRH